MTNFTACPDPDVVAERAASAIERLLLRAVQDRGRAHLGLSGGTTPARTYELLASRPAALAHAEVWFADERCVPPDDEESNYLLAQRTLLDPAQLPPERIHRMRGELGPEDGAAAYAQELAAAFAGAAGQLPLLDVIVLGIGPDGHVASLFPGAPTLQAPPDAVCLGVRDSPKPPPERITLSMPVLRAARSCALLATGAGKADAVAAMLGEASAHVPASLLARERLSVFVDDAAAPPPLR